MTTPQAKTQEQEQEQAQTRADAPAPAPAPPAHEGRRAAGAARTRHALGRVLATVARSAALFVPVFLVATFVTFALRSLSGLSPARIQLGEQATPEAIARVESQWGLDRPFLVQYGDWIGGVLHGRLGTSWTNGADISTLIGLGLGVSLSVALFALVIGVVAGFALGTLAALRRSTWVDRVVTGFVTVISVMPAFVVGIVLVTVLAVGLGLFPSAGYVEPGQGIGPWLAHITLPAVALSFDVVADVARQLRTSLVAAYRENYVTGALVRGLSPRRIFFGHVLRNGLGPTLATLGLKFPSLVGASVVTEWIFGLQGFGRFANDSAQSGDVPAVQGVLVVSIVLVVAFNLVVNLVLARVTPASQRGV
jgi:peptide/nickel transport system permease protein